MKSNDLLIPYVPTPEDKVEIVLKFSNVMPGIKTVDLGAGDGRIVIAMAKAGAEAHGYEIITKYARRATFNIFKEGLKDKAFIHISDFGHEDLNSYDVITIYGMITIMDKLEKKLSQEVKHGAVVISNGFPIPNWIATEEEDHIFCYIKR